MLILCQSFDCALGQCIPFTLMPLLRTFGCKTAEREHTPHPTTNPRLPQLRDPQTSHGIAIGHKLCGYNAMQRQLRKRFISVAKTYRPQPMRLWLQSADIG